MSSSKPSATRPAKDNMLDFSAGEAETFLKTCTARVYASQPREITKNYLDLAALFGEEDWAAVSASIRNRTPEHMRIFYRNNRDDIIDHLIEKLSNMPPTPPGSGANSPKGPKRGRESDDDESSNTAPNKRQTTESNSPKARRTNSSTSLPSSVSASVSSEATEPREQSTSASSSPDNNLKISNSTIQKAAVDSAQQTYFGGNKDQDETEAQAEGDNGTVSQLEATLKFVKEQLVRTKKRHADEIAALKQEHKLELDTKTAEFKHKEYQLLGLEDRIRKLEDDEDDVKKNAQREAAYAREEATNKMMEADEKVKAINEKAKKLVSQAKKDAENDVGRVQKQLDYSNKHAEDQFKDLKDEWHKNQDLEKALEEEKKSFAALRSHLNKLQERAGLERDGRPKENQRLAFYGLTPTKPYQAPLYTQHAVNHACERYFMQMSRDYFKADEGNWSKFVDKVQGLYKRHGFPVPIYYGGGEEKKS
ncbi:uncharacterized protein MYCFIDRAFT_82170 [Pseudocercospora fijiensis CIRAD86]|uniref:Uncharacterized protein n=1 Tax=Pseudocercospora fijiensis (strain CIRAD86) TaxID=383855 RepID=M3BAA6_PSEFD|nr:uncharacterized protein MYCFIDRAFT_82170 [Pseudocercospora fijiensis CIRAD86]EME86242.1 hypothetical protein MYCFIDRAFT_82170 [Pseudocercospora fijiensis CIRAD86]